MDNYKILYKGDDDMEVKLELLNQLGFQNIGMSDEGSKEWLFTYDNSDFYQAIKDENFAEIKELTLPQLRDLVVLKRNDVNDANYESVDEELDDLYFKDSSGKLYRWFCGSHWTEAASYKGAIRPINKPQDPALISGAEAKLAWANGESVQFRDEFDKWYEDWTDLNSKKNGFWITDFDLPHHQFRIKPTLTVNAELPKPHKETQQNTEVYAVTYEFKTREERNAFADKLRGTNS